MKEFEIAQELVIEAPREKVWKALTTEIGKWWAFHIGEAGSQITLEARLGGAFAERWGDGEGALWGTVTYLKVGERLRLEGALGMSGPGVNKYTYDLEDCDRGTTLKLTHFGFGQRDDEVEKDYTEGWQTLLGKYLTGWLIEGKTHDQLPKE